MSWRTWSLAVLVAVVLTTAACLGPVWLIGTTCMLLPLGGIGLAHLVLRRRVEPSQWPDTVDVAAFQDTAWRIEAVRRKVEGLSVEDRRGVRGRVLMAEFRALCGVLQTQYRGEEVEMPIMDPFPVCPSCDVKGAAAAELDPSGGAWGRTCWECGHRWTEL